MHNNKLSRPAPRTVPGELRRFSAQRALWVRSLRVTGKSTTLSMRGNAGTCRCVITGTSKPKSCTRNRHPLRPAAPPLHHPGTHFGGSRAPPKTDVIIAVTALYGLGSPTGRRSPFPEGRRRSTVWCSGQPPSGECHPSSDRLAAPADPLADTQHHQPASPTRVRN